MKTYLPVKGQGVTPEGRIVGYDADWAYYNAEPLTIGTIVSRMDTFETLAQALNAPETFEAFVCEPHDEGRVVVTDLWDRADCLHNDEAYRETEIEYYEVIVKNETVVHQAPSIEAAIDALVEVFLNPTALENEDALYLIAEEEAELESATVQLARIGMPRVPGSSVILTVEGWMGEEGTYTEVEITAADVAFIRNACRVAKAMELSRTPGQITFSVSVAA